MSIQSRTTLEQGRRIAAAGVTALALAFTPLSTTAFELVETQDNRNISLSVGAGQMLRTGVDYANVFVANPEVADVQVASSRVLYLTATGVGETTLFVLGDDDEVLMSADLRVTHNARALSAAFAQVAPGQPVRARSIENSLIVTGRVQSAEQAADVIRVAGQFAEPERIINRLAIAEPQQVNLQVRIAEVSRNMDQQIGIRWNEIGLQWNELSGENAPGIRAGFNRATGEARSGVLNVNVILEALSEEGLVTILAEPNLTARTGEPASFLAGGEFPFQSIEDDSIITEFKDFGIGLNFTPTVIDGNRISLNITTEVSDLDFSAGGNVPALNTRRASTVVDLGSGQSFAIAGLIENSSSQDVARVPGLGSIPILGALFRSTGFQRGQTELVILVTPTLVEPSRPEDLRTPLDNFTPPNDLERILLGRFEGSGGTSARNGKRRLHGAAGFAFE